LDRTSQRIIQLIAAHQTETVEGTPLKFAEFDRELTLHRHAGLAELQRHRRQFVKINGQHPPGSSKAVGASFIDFLALQL
jgi:tRNA uridine 5-carbamoylmethylation protein Kti12